MPDPGPPTAPYVVPAAPPPRPAEPPATATPAATPAASPPPRPTPGPGTSSLGGATAAGATTTTAAAGATAQPLRTPARTRRAKLVVKRVDPWSVLKFSLLFSLCLLIVFVVAVAALYFALQALGVFDTLNEFIRNITEANIGDAKTGGVEVPISAFEVIGVAAIIGLINVVLVTAISTLGAFLYNLCADIVGGVEVTLAERD
jgi:hypothetical protein